MLAALKEYTLDIWDLLVGNQYPRTGQLTKLREVSERQQKQDKLSLEQSLSTPRQPSVVTEDVPSGSASVCIKMHQQQHEEF